MERSQMLNPLAGMPLHAGLQGLTRLWDRRAAESLESAAAEAYQRAAAEALEVLRTLAPPLPEPPRASSEQPELDL
jgi:hypothetical protein